MLSNEQYVRLSLELNLFFLRIAKEHAIFAAASLPPKFSNVSMQLVTMKHNLEKLLARTLTLAKGNIPPQVMQSSTLVTPLTLPAEKATQFLTGIPIDTSITVREINLGYRNDFRENPNIVQNISTLNRNIIASVTSGIKYQSNLLRQILSCKAFSFVYPLNLDHVTREAQAYVNMLTRVESRQEEDTTIKGLIQKELFWNDIMDEHAKFIRGYLDPSEAKLFNIADQFAKKFDELESATKALQSNPANFNSVTNNTLNLVTELRNFKRQSTEGLLSCKIKSIMSPLLADHVTREANYYLRLLRNPKV